MLKIADFEDAPNPDAVKFALEEPLTWGITYSYENAAQAQDDALATALFDTERVSNVFYLDEWITVTQDGGTISIVEGRQGKLFITMSGRCQGCASSQVTLRQGLEVVLKRVAPESKEIVDATNHAAGNQPFYSRHELKL